MVRENRGGARPGSGRPKGKPQPHLRDPEARRNRVTICLSDRELAMLRIRAGAGHRSIAGHLYQIVIGQRSTL